MSTNPVSKWVLPVRVSQDPATYKTNIDNDMNVAQQIVDMFAPHEQTSPNMTVRLDAGSIFDFVAATLTPIAAQSTGTITTPSVNPRIDRVVVDVTSGAVSVITGAENASPVAPTLTVNKWPIAQVLLQTSTTTITNSIITDERNFNVSNQGLVAINTFNASGTWTKPSGLGVNAMAFVQVWGGGGSGGAGAYSGGGGGGSYKEAWFLVSSLGSTETVTVGTGGATQNGTNANGNAGGLSSFGSWLTGYGGSHGAGSATSAFGGGSGGWFSTTSGRSNDTPTGEGYGGLSATNPVIGYYVGGGGGQSSNLPSSAAGANSVFGGAGGGNGGGSSTLHSGGTSTYGGAGGAGTTSGAAIAGTQPAGGGGGSPSGSASGAGGNGRIIVTVYNG